MERNNDIRISRTAEDLALSAAAFILEVARKAVVARGRFSIAFSGGSTPKTLFLILSKPPFAQQIPWKNTFAFWGDERCVPADDPRNNAHVATTLLLNKVAIPSENIYPVPVDMPSQTAAAAYETIIRDFFGNEEPHFDLILLGLGSDGHTASIFPNSDLVLDARLVAAIALPEINRISMMPVLINNARQIAFLVSGPEKSKILKEVLTAPFHPKKYPAQLIRPRDSPLHWFIDTEAAALLT